MSILLPTTYPNTNCQFVDNGTPGLTANLSILRCQKSPSQFRPSIVHQNFQADTRIFSPVSLFASVAYTEPQFFAPGASVDKMLLRLNQKAYTPNKGVCVWARCRGRHQRSNDDASNAVVSLEGNVPIFPVV